MDIQNHDPLRRAAGQLADCLAECGYAFVEDDKLDDLAAVLRSFLTVAGIPVNAATATNQAVARSERFPLAA